MEFLKEFIRFLSVRKKYWLLPTIIIIFLFAIYKDLNSRVVALLKRLDHTINGLKKFMVLNQEQKDEIRKIMIKEDKKK